MPQQGDPKSTSILICKLIWRMTNYLLFGKAILAPTNETVGRIVITMMSQV